MSSINILMQKSHIPSINYKWMAFGVKKSMLQDQPSGWPQNCNCSCVWNAQSGRCSSENCLQILLQPASLIGACLWNAAYLAFSHSFSAWWWAAPLYPIVFQTASWTHTLICKQFSERFFVRCSITFWLRPSTLPDVRQKFNISPRSLMTRWNLKP